MGNGDTDERVVRTRRVKIVNKTACGREDEGRKKSWGELLYLYPPRVEEQNFVYLAYLGNGRKARLPSEHPAALQFEFALAAIFPAFEMSWLARDFAWITVFVRPTCALLGGETAHLTLL